LLSGNDSQDKQTDVKAIPAESGDGLSLSVCDNHAHHNDATFDFDGKALTQRGKGRSLLAGLRETEFCEKEEGGPRREASEYCNPLKVSHKEPGQYTDRKRQKSARM
jgi:hypothetical protein